MNNHDDDLLDQYLSGDSELSALYQSGRRPEPKSSTAVDQAILAAAKKSVEDARPTPPSRRRPGWFVPLSIAATLVLSTSLYLLNQPSLHRSDDALPLAPPHSPPAQRFDEADQQPRGAEPELHEQQSPGGDQQLPRSLQEPAARLESAAKHATAENKAQQNDRQPMTQQPSPNAFSSEPFSAGRAGPDRSAAPVSSLRSMPSMTDSADQAEAAQQGPSTTTAAATPDPGAAPEDPDLATGFTLPARAQRSVVTGDQQSAADAMEMEAAPSNAFEAQPGLWLDHILALLKAADYRQARDELTAFQRQYPDYPLPGALTRQLQRPNAASE